MNLEDLKKPFSINDIEWRVQQSGMKNSRPWAMVLAYVTNRAIQNRLDAVCGADKWKNYFRPGPQGGVLCGISIKVKDEWITKWDGADNTKIEPIKGGLSDSMKRAAVQWGIGRYLYDLHEGWAKFVKDGCYKCKIENKWYEWNPPALLPEFLPEEERESQKKQAQTQQTASSTQQQTAPRTNPPPIESSKPDAQKAIKLEIHNRLVEMYGQDYAAKGTLERITEWEKDGKPMPGIKSLREKISDRRLGVIRGKVSIEYKKFLKTKGKEKGNGELPF